MSQMSQSQSQNRWNTLVSKGMVIPFEDLAAMTPDEFRDKCGTVIYQLAKEVYELRKDLEDARETIKALKKKTKRATVHEEVVHPLGTCNTFSLLED